ncbi:MAG: type II toxin-antitoxin system HipA family toxin [Candidatus Methanoperedens sp.]
MESLLDVFLNNELIGHLWLDQKRKFAFQYTAEWVRDSRATSISLSLPLREQLFSDDEAHPFFSNLLPEADIRRVIASKLGISEKNDFALLEIMGGECAGAVSVLPRGVLPTTENEYKEIDDTTLHEIVTDLPHKPLMAGEEGIRLSLAGAQNKLPIYIDNDKISIPIGSAPSTHILKTPMRDREGTVENETFCMMLAHKIGLPVPAVMIRRNSDTLYVIQRYDRRIELNGKISRIHQEDFCQALCIPPDQKYQSEGGPSLRDCFDLLKKQSISPAVDQKTLISWVVFNVLIGNADAHAKNISILFTDKGPRLAPFYDLLCTMVYPDLNEKLAMKVGGENRPEWIQLRHWERFAEEINIKPKLVLKIVESMASNIIENAKYVDEVFRKDYGSSAITEKIISTANGISRKILLSFKI